MRTILSSNCFKKACRLPASEGRLFIWDLLIVSVEVKFGFPVEDCSVARLQRGVKVVEEEAPAVPPAGGGHRHPGRSSVGGVLEEMPPGLPHPGLAALRADIEAGGPISGPPSSGGDICSAVHLRVPPHYLAGVRPGDVGDSANRHTAPCGGFFRSHEGP